MRRDDQTARAQQSLCCIGDTREYSPGVGSIRRVRQFRAVNGPALPKTRRLRILQVASRQRGAGRIGGQQQPIARLVGQRGQCLERHRIGNAEPSGYGSSQRRNVRTAADGLAEILGQRSDVRPLATADRERDEWRRP